MDRKTLLMVLFFTLSLIGVNLYFDSQRHEEWQKWNEERFRKLIEQREGAAVDLTKRLAPLDSLPLFSLYEGERLVGYGAGAADAMVVMPYGAEGRWPDELRATALRGGSGDGATLKKMWSDGQDIPFAIYAKEGRRQLTSADLSLFGAYDLQLVMAQKGKLVTTVVEYREGKFQYPTDEIAALDQKLADEERQPPRLTAVTLPLSDGLLFMRQKDRWLPVALFRAEGQEVLPLQTLEVLTPYLQTAPQEPLDKGPTEERFYLLQNEYQQLLFSSRGGSLAEINLAQQGESHPHSVIKPIEVDRQLVAEDPANARFPSHPYYVVDGAGQQQLVKEGALGGFYPLLRRQLVGTGPRELSREVPTRFFCSNIVSQYPEVAQLNYRVTAFSANKITFEAQQQHRRIRKTYSIDGQAPYCFTLEVEVEGDKKGLWLVSGVPEVEMISGAPSPTLQYRQTRQGRSEVKQIDLPQESTTYGQVKPDWICNSNGFFAVIMDPQGAGEGGFRSQYVSGETLPSRLLALPPSQQHYSADKLPGYMLMMPLEGGRSQTQWRFFAGPLATSVLKAVDAHYSDAVTGYNPDYLGAQTFHGYFEVISAPFAKFLFWLMSLFYALTNSWGISIILLTIALRLLLYPLNAWSLRSSMRMQEVMPQIQAIQEKYKKDPQKGQMEVLKLYREKGANPLSGCLPLLIQLPFLIGMFDLLKTTFELRGASFIPGWIDNLAAPDVLFSWTTPLPLIGNQFHLLPILTGLVMLLQQKLMAPSVDAASMTEKQRQQRAAGTIMSVVFTIMFYNFPSGINIYWISSSLVGILQQWWMKRGGGAAATPVSDSKSTGAVKAKR